MIYALGSKLLSQEITNSMLQQDIAIGDSIGHKITMKRPTLSRLDTHELRSMNSVGWFFIVPDQV